MIMARGMELVSNESPRSNTYNILTKSPEPNPPYSVQVEIKDNGIRISWDYTEIPNHPVTSFIIKYIISESNQAYEYVHDVQNLRDDTLKRQIDFKNLDKGLKYIFRVQAKNLNGYSLDSEPQIIAIPATLPEGPVKNVFAIPLSESRVFISWDPPDKSLQNGIIKNYPIKYSLVDSIGSSPVVSNKYTTTSLTRIVITNLLPDKTYSFTIAANNSAGVGPWSRDVKVHTFNTNTSSPQNVRVISSSKLGSIKVQWDPPFISSVPVEFGYKVFYSDNPSLAFNKWQTKIVPQKHVEETNLDGLMQNTLYGIRVATRLDESGTVGTASKMILHRVGPTLPDNFDLKPIKIESSYIIFQWKKPTGMIITQYKLKYFNMEDPNADKGVITMTANATLCLVSELKPFTQYSFNLSVFSLDSIGNEVNNLSVQYTAYTKATVPNEVPTPEMVKVDENGLVTLKMTVPSSEQGPIDGYQVILVEFLEDSLEVTDLPKPEEIFVDNDFDSHEVPLKRILRDEKPGHASYYISNRVKRSNFLSQKFRASIVAEIKDFYSAFALGDGKYYGKYFNKKLKDSATYTVFVRALVYTEVALYRCSDYMIPFNLKDSPPMSIEPQSTKDPFISLFWVICIVATAIIVIIIILLFIYLYKRKNHVDNTLDRSYSNSSKMNYSVNAANGKYHPMPLSIQHHHSHSPSPHSPSHFSFNHNLNGGAAAGLGPIGMPPGYKTVQTDDPVEKRRLNFPTNELRCRPPISSCRLEETIECLKTNNNLRFYQEFKSIEPGQQFTWEHSNMDVNKSKNRYANVIAYDHSRVHLRTIDGVPGSDYINANYMDGFRREKAYISTQGPLEETVADFWRMVWEQNSYTIVMMTKLEEKSRTKCDQYWPEKLNSSELYGAIKVLLIDVEIYASHTVRTLKISHMHDTPNYHSSRDVKQFQFTAWPDHGVPEHATPVLNFIRKIKILTPDNSGPMVVHCSAGVGRTGCFIVIDTQLEKIVNDDQIDIYGHVTCLRAQRQYMVQTEDQYIFCYDAILEAIQSGVTEFPKYEIEDRIQRLRNSSERPGDNRTGLESEFERLSNVTHSPSKFSVAMLPENMPKNRLANIKPFDATRVKLQPIRGQVGSDYINASFIDSYFDKDCYIATQGPLESTVFDFWRMVWEYNCGIIVMLTKLKELGREKCFQYWPKPNAPERHNYLLVEPVQEYAMTQFVMREFRLCDAREGVPRKIRQFHFEWPEQGVPKQNQAFVDFIRHIDQTKNGFPSSSGAGPIVVHCSSGSARTGVFIALKVVLDRMDNEGLVDVFQTVKMLRTQRPAMVQTEDQYEFIYQAALDYFRVHESYDYYNNSRC